MGSPVVLINVFSVLRGKEEQLFAWWDQVKTAIVKERGFISGRLHRSIKADSRFQFINVAQWESEELYWKAFEKSAAPMKAHLAALGVEMTPALFRVALEY